MRVLTQTCCAGQLEGVIKKSQLIGRLQDQIAGLTATVEVQQRMALRKLRESQGVPTARVVTRELHMETPVDLAEVEALTTQLRTDMASQVENVERLTPD